MEPETFDDFLAHYGVAGMKWGQRKAQFSKNRDLNRKFKESEKKAKAKAFAKVRKDLRPSQKFDPKGAFVTNAALFNKDKFNTTTPEGKAKYNAAKVKEIERARARFKSGAAKADLKEARAKYKEEKISKGKLAAKKTLNETKTELYYERMKAQTAKNNVERGAKVVQFLLS